MVVIIIALSLYSSSTRTSAPAPSQTQSMASTTQPIPAATTTSAMDTSSWKTYDDSKLGLSIKYPGNLAVNATMVLNGAGGPQSVTFSFPKATYFSTVLKDDVIVGIVATSSCPALNTGAVAKNPQHVSIHGVDFLMSSSTDAAAGNRYETITYDTMHTGLCYRVTFFVHGTNGAGLYVSDPAQIKSIDAAHDFELARVTNIFLGMLGTLSFK